MINIRQDFGRSVEPSRDFLLFRFIYSENSAEGCERLWFWRFAQFVATLRLF